MLVIFLNNQRNYIYLGRIILITTQKTFIKETSFPLIFKTDTIYIYKDEEEVMSKCSLLQKNYKSPTATLGKNRKRSSREGENTYKHYTLQVTIFAYIFNR